MGADIGGTKISVSIGDAHAGVLGRHRFPTASFPGPEKALAEIVRSAERLAAERGLPLAEASGVGVSCAGPLDTQRGLVLSPPNLPGWDRVPVCEILGRRLVPLRGTVRLENDANAAALAEWQFGAGRGTRHMVFLTCSTGMGAGIILDGRLYRGSRDLAGEVGHIRLTEEGPARYGKPGSFEGWASGTGLAALAGRTAEAVGRDALAGDPKAQALVARAGEMLGRGIAVLCDVLNPELVVCGTLAVHLGDLYLEPARRVLAREALAPCPVVPAALGEELAEKASLCVALGND